MTRVKASEYLFLADMLPAARDGNVVGVRYFQAQCTQVFSDIKTARMPPRRRAGIRVAARWPSCSRRRGRQWRGVAGES